MLDENKVIILGKLLKNKNNINNIGLTTADRAIPRSNKLL